MPDPSATILEPLPDGSFRLRRGDGIVLSAIRAPDGFRIAGEGIEHWRLVEGGRDERGYVLIAGTGADAVELGRTCRAAEDGGVGPVWALLDDGRLFEIHVGALRPPVVDLCPEEVRGAFWRASPDGDGWRIEPTTAGCHLDVGPSLWVLFGSELNRWSRQEGSRHG